MKNTLILLFFSLLAVGCEKFDGVVSPPQEELPVSATIHGQVAIDGVGLNNVDVNLHFFGMVSRQTRTNQDGKYSFIVGRVGDYVVSITNPDIYLYSFASNSKAINVLPKSDKEVNFTGTYIGDGGSIPQPPVINATVHGQVIVDGIGLANVHVAIAINNRSFYLVKTNDGGYYTFTGLGKGDYVVFITNPDENLYSFTTVTKTVTVVAEGSFEANFIGIYIGVALPPNEPIPQPPSIAKAIIAGVAYEDTNNNGLYDGGEPVFVGLAVGLSGNGIVLSIVTDSNGRYAFKDLQIGSYDVLTINTYSSTHIFDFERDLIVSSNVTIADDAGTIVYKDFRAVRR